MGRNASLHEMINKFYKLFSFPRFLTKVMSTFDITGDDFEQAVFFSPCSCLHPVSDFHFVGVNKLKRKRSVNVHLFIF